MHDVEITRAAVEDAGEILSLQKLAYQSQAELYNDYSIPPLTQTLEELRAEFEDHVILKAIAGGRVIGTVRAREEDGTCYVGRLAVEPAWQNNGLGTALLNEIEKHFDCGRFELFTGSRSDNSIHLYEKLGYRVIGTDTVGCGEIKVFVMEKSV